MPEKFPKTASAKQFPKIIFVIILLMLVSLVIYTWASKRNFRKAADQKVKALIPEKSDVSIPDTFSLSMIENLPQPLQQYFLKVIDEGQDIIQTVRLKQKGDIRLKEDTTLSGNEGWQEFQATQYIFTPAPGYIWMASIKIAPFINLQGFDHYLNGEGILYWRLLSAIPVVNAQQDEIDKSALIRFLAEAPLYPTVLLPNDKLKWKYADEQSASVTFSDAGMEVAATFYFDENSFITRLETNDKFRSVGDNDFQGTKWIQYFQNYQDLHGVKIPTGMEAAWELPSGIFKYAKIVITNIDYNLYSMYKSDE